MKVEDKAVRRYFAIEFPFKIMILLDKDLLCKQKEILCSRIIDATKINREPG